jgi:hypothetical protein
MAFFREGELVANDEDVALKHLCECVRETLWSSDYRSQELRTGFHF